MAWQNISTIDAVNQIKNAVGYSVIFKHSTRCSVSLMAKKRFEYEWDTIPATTPIYFLDLIKHRDVSAQIAEIFQVFHESPQALLIKDGQCILDSSHSEIDAEEIAGIINGDK